MIVALIAAVARNGTIGHQGKLPWHIPADLKRFKRLTIGHPVIMGRKTFQSIGKPLPGRRNIILTRDVSFVAPSGVEVFRSLDAALEDSRGRGEDRVFVIGGADVYRQALPIADALYLTLVSIDIEGDTVFPAYDREDWIEVNREESSDCIFVDYHRRVWTLPDSTGIR